jgi:hypothetical protein
MLLVEARRSRGEPAQHVAVVASTVTYETFELETQVMIRDNPFTVLSRINDTAGSVFVYSIVTTG